MQRTKISCYHLNLLIFRKISLIKSVFRLKRFNGRTPSQPTESFGSAALECISEKGPYRLSPTDSSLNGAPCSVLVSFIAFDMP